MTRLKYCTGTLTIIALFMVSAPNAVWGNKETIVSEETAFEIAAVALAQQVLIPSPSMYEEQIPEFGWESARIGPSRLIHDINGEPFVFIFPIIAEDSFSHSGIWVAANKLLGTTVIAVYDVMVLPDVDAAASRALRQASCRYPGWEVKQTLPVIYNYPRIGVMLKLSKPGTNETIDLIYDLYDLSEAPTDTTHDQTDRSLFTRNISSSYFKQIPDSEHEKRIHSWHVKHDWDLQMLEILSMSDGFPQELRAVPLKEILDLKNILKKYYACMQCEQYTTRKSWTHYCQSGVPYCAAAVGRNIAKYYGVSHPESKVAQLMGITNQDWPTVEGELIYYKSPNGLNKKGTVNFRDINATGTAHLKDWKSIKTEILKDTIYTIPSSIGFNTGWGKKGPGGWKQPGHWKVLNYIRVCKSANGSEDVTFGLFDPYPPSSCGDKQESFLFLKSMIRSHTIPQDPGKPPTYPSKPAFEPWKCKLHWYRMMYPASCQKWDDMLKKVAKKDWEIP